MKARALGIVGRLTALAFSCSLAACASGSIAPSPEFLASQPPPNSLKSASVSAPTDVAGLPDEPSEIADPYEKMNRSVFEGNQRFNHAVVYPVAKAYATAIPEPVRNSVKNFATNLTEPMVFANDVVQLRLGAAATTFGRFALNSTVGIGGLFDIASKKNLQRQTGDFGQTLYVFGMRNSDYLVVPVIGPTNVRDLIGTTVDFIATIPAGSLLQTGLAATQFAATANNLTVAGSIATPIIKLDEVGQLETLEDNSLDFYAMLRSVAAQKRQAELDEAVATSGWTASSRNGGAVASTSLSIAPKAKEDELLANVLTSPQ